MEEAKRIVKHREGGNTNGLTSPYDYRELSLSPCCYDVGQRVGGRTPLSRYQLSFVLFPPVKKWVQVWLRCGLGESLLIIEL